MVYFYNLNKGGVDDLDQTLSQRRTIKWWKKISFNLFEVGIPNCCIYHRLINACDSKYRSFDFRTALAQQLIDKYANLKVTEVKEFSHYPIQVECKVACKNEGCKKNRILINVMNVICIYVMFHVLENIIIHNVCKIDE